MTKSWSIIRNQIGKEKAPLDLFFRIICPYLNVPSPDTYLESCGWALNADDEGTPTLSRESTPSPEAMSAGTDAMALSVEDIINYCQGMGYAQEYISDTDINSPIFLAQTHNQSTSKTASPTYESRLAARNKRRAKRQTTRDVSIASILQQQIFGAHGVEDLRTTYQDNYPFGCNEPVQSYDDLADLLINHLGQDQQATSGDTAGFVAIANPILAGWTDWGAFRLGADENATLPSFDPATM